MKSLNRVDLIGYARNVEYFEEEKMLRFSVLTTERWVTQGEPRERKELHQCLAWDRMADYVDSWIENGDLVWVSGKIRTYQGETQIHVDDYMLCRKSPARD